MITIRRDMANRKFHPSKLGVSSEQTGSFIRANSKAIKGVPFVTLSLLLLMLFSAAQKVWGQTYYVFKYEGHYLAHNGYTTDGSEICVENEFSITKCLWEHTDGGDNNRQYLKTYGADYWFHYLSNTSNPENYIHTLVLKNTVPQPAQNKQDGWHTTSTTGIKRWLRTTSSDPYLEHNVCYNSDNNKWELVLATTNPKKATGTVLTKTETSYKNISSSIEGGSNVISAFGNYNYSLGDITVNNLSCVSFTDGGKTCYWYEDSEHNTAPEDWGDVNVASLTKTWSLSGPEGYATVDAATGELTISHLPHKNSAKITLTCTISDGSHSYAVSKTITLKPRTLRIPTISMSVSTVTITSTDDNVDCYYTTSIYGEPFTDAPTTKSTKYEAPFTIDNDVICVKAIAVEENGPVSEAASFNILPFTTNKVSIGGGKTATVSPFVYSYDVELPENTKAYIVKRVTSLDHSAILSEVGYIPKDVPVLLLDERADPQTGATGITLSIIEDFNELEVNKDEDLTNDINPITDSEKAANQLKVSDGKVTVQDAQVYMYYNDEFVLTYAGTIKKGRFYLDNPNYLSTTTATNAPTLQLVIEGTTGIDEVRRNMEEGRGEWYTLDGRRLNGQPVRKGIYINNGQKMVIK